MNIAKKFKYFLLITLSININAFEIRPNAETPQVPINGDADDPAIWINPLDLNKSIIFGTDKYNGIYAYNMNAEKLTFIKAGNINNIDLRPASYDKKNTTLFYGSNRSSNTLDLWILNNKDLDTQIKTSVLNIPINASYSGEANMIVYGVCAGYHPYFGDIAFITEDMGSKVQLWSFKNKSLSLIHEFQNADAAQSEGCVYDDENQTLFISEEQDRGILRAYKITNDLNMSDVTVIDTRDGNIVGDPEGVTIYKTSNHEGYLILSSQGDSKFNLYDRKYPYDYIDSFSIKNNGDIDEVTDTDGVDVTHLNLGPKYPLGLMVVQDGNNSEKNKVNKQNFKFVSFKQVLNSLNIK